MVSATANLSYLYLRGPIPPWTPIAIGGALVLSVLIGAVAGKRRPGYETTTGRVVEHREGKRPTVIEFVPVGAKSVVHFKYGEPVPIGEELQVSYSLADPRNASVIRQDTPERRFGPYAMALLLIVGALFILAGVLNYT